MKIKIIGRSTTIVFLPFSYFCKGVHVKRGVPMIPTHNLLGYMKDQYGRLMIDETEAKIVRLIYDSYIEGMTASEIASSLMTSHIPIVTGLEPWTSFVSFHSIFPK